MANSATNFSRNGVSDWIIQRVSAVILAAYTVFMVGYLMCAEDLVFSDWKMFFDSLPIKVFTALAVLSLVSHAWVGMWTISTDYIKPVAFRLLFQMLTVLGCFVYLFWTIVILWG